MSDLNWRGIVDHFTGVLDKASLWVRKSEPSRID